MENGLGKFGYYVEKLETLLVQSEKEKDAGAYLYANDARTIIFMLEGLSKLYEGMYKKKRFSKINAHFKLLEDALGAIDYYDSFAKEFKDNPRTPITVTIYLQGVAAEKTALLNKLLIKEKWIGHDPTRLSKICKKLKGAGWKTAKEDMKRTAAFYKDSIEDINVLALESEKGFEELEDEVHELRRKLRWLSIYPRAMQGSIQLSETTAPDQQRERYLTPEIVNSPFNKMPDAGNNTSFLLLEKNNFLALSWVIAAFGKLKDNGLRIFALCEALEQTEAMDHVTATRIACELLGVEDDEIQKILDRASAIAKDYFEGKYLENLVQGTNNI